MMNSILAHHGVLGQKWGVRRYQNKDGSLTKEGQKHRYVNKTVNYVNKTIGDVQKIVDSISDKERRMLGGTPGTPYLKADEVTDVAKRFIKKVENTPVAFLDVYYGRKNAGSIGIVTRGGEEYRGKGYGKELVDTAKKWLDTPEAKKILDMKMLDWFALRENSPSINLAKKSGFIEREDYKKDKTWWGGTYHR